MAKLLLVIQTLFASHESEDDGATMVEYGIMVAAIAVAVMGVAIILGGEIAALFQDVVDAI